VIMPASKVGIAEEKAGKPGRSDGYTLCSLALYAARACPALANGSV
jgi:hypothetical protein